MIRIERITPNNQVALKLPNEPFALFGRLMVSRIDGKWQFHEVLFDNSKQTQTFPNEKYDLAVIEQNGFALGAFAGKTCVGLAIFENRWNHYLYLSDLKVVAAYRRKKIASQLMDKATKLAKENDMRGLTTIAQDNNLGANRFYLHYGFEIGGLNTKNYQFTKQKGKADIYYY
ncbi:GNAT family N-acetyltransferase, partial [Liquorilactobacillus vini]